jgi:hypothetical protein
MLPRFFLGLFEREDGGHMFLRNIGSVSTEYTALYSRRYTIHNRRCENKKSCEYIECVYLMTTTIVNDRLSGLVVRVPGYRSRVPGLIPGATRFSEK